jgi:hypothetical protein
MSEGKGGGEGARAHLGVHSRERPHSWGKANELRLGFSNTTRNPEGIQSQPVVAWAMFGEENGESRGRGGVEVEDAGGGEGPVRATHVKQVGELDGSHHGQLPCVGGHVGDDGQEAVVQGGQPG